MAMALQDIHSGTDEDPVDECFDPFLFQEPAHYRPVSPPAKQISHTLRSGRTLQLRLVGHNPLWGHFLWNGARVLADYIESHPSITKGKTVLELGAGAGLPGLVAAVEGGADAVVLTDYPDEDLVDNLRHNAAAHASHVGSDLDDQARASKVVVRGYLWGDRDSTALFDGLPHHEKGEQAFDVLLLADLNFNHSCHEALAETIRTTLKRSAEARALVFFTPYRPWLLDKDLGLFDVCREKGLEVNKILEKELESVMFEQDPGDKQLRRTVFGYEILWGS